MAEFSNVQKRVVYVEDELDSGGDEFEFGFLGDGSINLPALCSDGGCNEAALTTTYQETEMMTSQLWNQAPRCDADVVRDVTRVAWPPSEPYELARPSFDIESVRLGPYSKRKSKERFSYVKALLHSDTELERLAKKIRAEIRHSEMMELALEAEKAADAGLDTFSGKPSTFGEDGAPKPDHRNKLNPIALKRHRTFTEGIATARTPYFDNKLRVMSLRDITEVIPRWTDLHAHVKVHLHRHKVKDDALDFQETEQILDGAASAGCKIKNDKVEGSFSFLENFAGMTVGRLTSTGMIQSDGTFNRKACDRVVEDMSYCSGSSASGQFGPTLASHLSPKSGEILRRPDLYVPPGLAHPDDLVPESLSVEETSDGRLDSAPGVFLEQRSTGDNESLKGIASADSVSSSSTFHDSDKDLKRCVKGTREDGSVGLHVSEEISPNALLDEDDDDTAALRSSSPYGPGDVARLQSMEPSLVLTPKDLKYSRKTSPDFVTPARLRDIRISQRRNPPKGDALSVRAGVPTTPDHQRVSFEPSSIIDTGSNQPIDNNDAIPVPSVRQDPALFLALPSIQCVPNDKFFEGETVAGNSSITGKSHLQYSQPHLDYQTAMAIPKQDITSPARALGHSRPTGRISATSSNAGYTKQLRESLDTPVPPPQAEIYYNPRTSKNDERRQDDTSDPTQRSRDDTQENFDGTIYMGANVSRSQDAAGMSLPLKQNTIPVQTAVEFGGKNGHHGFVSTLSEGAAARARTNYCVASGTPLKRKTWKIQEIRRARSWPSGGFAVSVPLGRMSHQSFGLRAGTGTDDASAPDDQQPMLTRSESTCHSLQSADESIQAAVEGMLSRLSPGPKKAARDALLSDAENNEFLNNYFYCVPDTDKGARPNQKAAGRSHLDSMCHNIGVDSMCAGLQYLFSAKQPTREHAEQEVVSEGAVSLGKLEGTDDGDWLGLFGMGKGDYGLNFITQPKETKSSVCFQPPGLKPRNSSPAPFLGVPPSHPVGRSEPNNARFISVFGMNRDEFFAMPRRKRWQLIREKSELATGPNKPLW